MQKKISIIIPTFNSGYINEIIDCLNKQSCKTMITEIIIVGKQDSPKITGRDLVKYAPVDNPTAAHNRNVGAKLASEQWICFLDADCIPATDWLEKLSDGIEEGNDIIAGAIDLPSGSSYWCWCDHITGFFNQAYGLSKRSSLEYAASANLLIRKEIFTKFQGFNENFKQPAGEDREFCFRLKEAKLEIYFKPDAIVYHHHHRDNFMSAWKHIFNYGKATIQFRKLTRNHNISRKFEQKIARIRVIGEIAGLLWVIARSILKPIKNPGYLRYMKYWLGVIILDYALALGMIYTIRTYASEN